MLFTRFQVEPGEVAIEYAGAAPGRVLGAGAHRRARGAAYRHVSLRESLLMIDTQEILTSEQIPVKVSAAVRMRVVDPVLYVERSDAPEMVVYLAAQVALREAVAVLSLEELAQRTSALPVAEMTAAVARGAAGYGIEVLAVTVKDVILPAEVRRAAVAVAAAKAEGQAALERARAEVAALRAAANGAKILAENPALAHLRMIENVPAGTQLTLNL
ncbi:MAG: SPFH domain-containing protein [bacterium]|nr:SPFH domain-containing protein [bacterium]